MAPRQIRKPVKYKSDNATDEIFPQLKQTESGRYLIQVDKQTKASTRPPRLLNLQRGDQERTSDR